MEGVSLFGATPRLNVILAGGFIIPASHITSDAPSAASEVFMPEEVRAQSFVRSESAADLGVILEISTNVSSVVDHSVQAEGASASATATPVGSEHLDNIGEFEFLTSFILLVIVCCTLHLVIPHQVLCGIDHTVMRCLGRLDCVIVLLFHRLGCCHMKCCVPYIFGRYFMEKNSIFMGLVFFFI